MTNASSLGSMTSAPPRHTKDDSGGWRLWETRPATTGIGNPVVFNNSIPESVGNPRPSPAATRRSLRCDGALLRQRGRNRRPRDVQDSRWLMSIVLTTSALHRATRGRSGLLGLRAAPDRVGDFVAKPMADSGWRRNPARSCAAIGTSIPQWSPARSASLPHAVHHEHVHALREADRPLPMPNASKYRAFVRPVRRDRGRRRLHRRILRPCRAQMAVYQLLGVARPVPPITRHVRLLKVIMNPLVKAMT